MISMRICLLLLRRIAKDRLLWCLVLASVLIHSILLFCDPHGAGMCQAANRLIKHYGVQVSADNVSAIQQDLNAVLGKASDTYQERYGEATRDVSILYDSGCFENEEEYEKAVLLQAMQVYGQAGLLEESQPRFYSVSELIGARDVLYKKLLPIACVESIMIAVYVMLRSLERSTVTNTAPLEYSSKQGKHIDVLKIAASFVVIVFVWLLVNTHIISLICVIYPGAISAVSSLPVVISKLSPAVDLPESTYLICWLGADFMVTCIYALLAASVGLVVRNSFAGTLILAAFSFGLFGCQMIPFDRLAFWNALAQWNPVGLFLRYKAGAITVQSEKWFLDFGAEYVLCGNELRILAAWLACSAAVLGLAWRFFQRRELTI